MATACGCHEIPSSGQPAHPVCSRVPHNNDSVRLRDVMCRMCRASCPTGHTWKAVAHHDSHWSASIRGEMHCDAVLESGHVVSWLPQPVSFHGSDAASNGALGTAGCGMASHTTVQMARQNDARHRPHGLHCSGCLWPKQRAAWICMMHRAIATRLSRDTRTPFLDDNVLT